MFGRKAQVAVMPMVEPEVVVEPKPHPATITLTPERLDEIAKSCAAIGYEPIAYCVERLKVFCGQNAIPIYDWGEVKRYLHGKFGDKYDNNGWAQSWGLAPVRPQDRGENGVSSWNHGVRNGNFDFPRVYDLAIPERALSRMALIAQSFENAKFFITDAMRESDRMADPFLVVVIPGSSERIVVAQWDEPGFDGVPI